jgi:D-3-phosphoglycerate dehydrogenase
MVVDQLRDYLEHGNVANAVNFPRVDGARIGLPRRDRQRQRAEHAGPDLDRDGPAGLNIHNMVNKSRGDVAYTLVDVDSPIGANVLADIAAIDGVLAARYLPLSD